VIDPIDVPEVGDTVKVFDINGKRVGQPEGGWDGEVTKVGRALITIKYAGRNTVFRIDTGRTNDAYAHQHYETVAEAARNERYAKARNTLTEFGLDFRLGKRATLDQVEALAELVNSFKGSE